MRVGFKIVYKDVVELGLWRLAAAIRAYSAGCRKRLAPGYSPFYSSNSKLL